MGELNTCLNCNNPFRGKYCNLCGEKVIVPKDRSLKSMVVQLSEALFSLDNKFFRSLKALLLSPGKLTRYYSYGPRKRFLSPMSLFIILSVIYFLFPLFQTFNADLSTHLNFGFYSENAAKIVMEYTQGNDDRFKEYMTAFNEATSNYGKMAIFIFVIVLLIPLSIINYSKDLFIADHAMASFEINAFLILLNALILPIIAIIGQFTGVEGVNGDEVMGPLILVFTLSFLIVIQKSYYKSNWWLTIIKAGLLMATLIYTLQIYRCVVFYVTHWSIT